MKIRRDTIEKKDKTEPWIPPKQPERVITKDSIKSFSSSTTKPTIVR
jgi:hypothetical protein